MCFSCRHTLTAETRFYSLVESRFTSVSFSNRVRAQCDELLNITLPLSGDTTVVLSNDAINCTILEDNDLEEFIIEGGTLTLTGYSTTK